VACAGSLMRHGELTRNGLTRGEALRRSRSGDGGGQEFILGGGDGLDESLGCIRAHECVAVGGVFQNFAEGADDGEVVAGIRFRSAEDEHQAHGLIPVLEMHSLFAAADGEDDLLDVLGAGVGKGDFVAQFTQVMSNLKTAIESIGGQPNQYAVLTIYVTELEAYWSNKKPLGSAYRAVFGKYFPAITLVEVKRLYNPDCMLEISGIAVID